MPDPATLLAFVVASTLLIVVPGPTVTLVVARSLSEGRAAAVPLAVGVAMGDLVATSLSLAGVGALLAASATAFTLVKWAGALYLVWVALGLWRAPPPAVALRDPGGDAGAGAGQGRAASRRALRDGFLVTVFNPKGIVFFVAFVPSFIDPSAPYAPQAVTFVALFTLIGAVNVLAYALGADRLRGAIARPAVLRGMARGGAVALGATGVATLLARRA